MKPLIYLYFFLMSNALFSQNLVLNPSFENIHPKAKPQPGTLKFQYPICGHTAHFSQFNESIEGWSSFMPGTPDLVIYPEDTTCFYPKPRTGKRMVGLITYHPKKDTWSDFDFHEVIQGTLRAPMHVGKTFEISFWVKSDKATSLQHLKTVYSRKTPILPCSANNLGIYFLEESMNENSSFWEQVTTGKINPHLLVSEVIQTEKEEWYQVKFTFTADKPYRYFMVGNFLPDEQTQTDLAPEVVEKIEKLNSQEAKNFWAKTKRVAYYCLDDFVVTPQKNNLTKTLTTDKNYTFQNLTFKSGSAEILPNSFAELEELAQFLKENKNLNIRIEGHTDNVGKAAANQILSEKRAAALVDFLTNNNIAVTRLKAIGKGATEPISDNNLAKGRQRNRRVQVIIE